MLGKLDVQQRQSNVHEPCQDPGSLDPLFEGETQEMVHENYLEVWNPRVMVFENARFSYGSGRRGRSLESLLPL